MQTKSPAGKKLNSELDAVVRPIWQRDPVRYKNLIKWVWTQQSLGFSDEAVGNCLTLAKDYLIEVGDWYPYLTRLMPKASGRAHETESDKYKREEKNFIQKLLKHCNPALKNELTRE